MKNRILHGSLALGLILNAAAQAPDAAPPAAEPAKPANEATSPPVSAEPAKTVVDPKIMKSDSSYALGYRSGATFGQQFGRFGVQPNDLEMETFIKGFMAGFKGGKPEVGEDKLQAAMAALGDMLKERGAAEGAANLEKGNKFLQENGKRPGVVTTPSGLQYEILAKGGDRKYEAPKDGSPDNKEFLVNYKGTLIDGVEFDASPPGQPVPMELGQVVPGFKEALSAMPVGSKWKVFIPAALAYGPERAGASIPPNSTLVFELELVDIKDRPAPQDAQFPMPMPQEGGE